MALIHDESSRTARFRGSRRVPLTRRVRQREQANMLGIEFPQKLSITYLFSLILLGLGPKNQILIPFVAHEAVVHMNFDRLAEATS
jgi:hypothetical protein